MTSLVDRLLPDELWQRIQQRVSVDSFSLRAVRGGNLTGANPTDRGKQGSKLHLAGERGGLPISVVLSAANANDSTMFGAVLDDVPPIRMSTAAAGAGPARSTPTRRTTTAAAARSPRRQLTGRRTVRSTARSARGTLPG
jgi:Transposase DDE domain